MYYFIVNPHARSGMGQKVWTSLDTVLKERAVNYQVFFTKYQRHATQIAREITSAQARCTIVVLGGDGTVNEVVNGITVLSDVTLGYIPIGSGNDLARGYSLSSDPVKALNHILTPTKYYAMNVGVLSYPNKRRRFAVSSGIGFDAEVCHQVVISKLKILLNRIKLGKLSYVFIGLQRIIAMTPGKMTLKLDDDQIYDFQKVYFIAAMNSRFEGGGFQFCPKADPGDDWIDIIVISDLSKLQILALLPTAFKGFHIHFKGVHIFRCKKAEVTSEKPLPVHTDGEPVFLQRQLCFSLEEEKIRIITS